jgi:hypothetical protein
MSDQTESREFGHSSAGRMLAALALLAVIGVASRARLDGGQALSTSDLAIVGVLLGALAMLVVGVGILGFGGGYAIFGESRRRLVSALVITALLAAVFALALAPIDADLNDGPQLPRPVRPRPSEGSSSGASEGDIAALVAAVVAGVTLLGALVALVGAKVRAERRWRRSAAAAAEGEVMMEAVEESLDDLRREPDVRRAIIASYARMERALERAGSARRPAEAPFEYLVRVLERMTVTGSAARALTELFERAKFAVEPMGEREKEQAIGALELLRAEVKASQ